MIVEKVAEIVSIIAEAQVDCTKLAEENVASAASRARKKLIDAKKGINVLRKLLLDKQKEIKTARKAEKSEKKSKEPKEPKVAKVKKSKAE